MRLIIVNSTNLHIIPRIAVFQLYRTVLVKVLFLRESASV